MVGTDISSDMTVSCVHDRSLSDSHILVKLAWICHWAMPLSWLVYGALDLVFKVSM